MPHSWNWLPARCGVGSARSRAGFGQAQGGQGLWAAAGRPGPYGHPIWTPHRSRWRMARGAFQGWQTRNVTLSGDRRMRGGESKEGFWRVSAGVACLSPFCRPPPLIITSALILPLRRLLIIFIADLSRYKNICQTYCLVCSNNSYYIIPSINYRQLHSLLFLLPLEVFLALSALTRVLST